MIRREFRAETGKVLRMVIDSVYTEKGIFLRELISNASDALDKLHFLAASGDGASIDPDAFQIRIRIDKEARTVTVSDNGIGMNCEDLDEHLGVIAHSGSRAFADAHEDSEEAESIIGQFGIGFYSAFMVADQVEVITQKYGEDTAYHWNSEGADGYSIEECTRECCGTDVILHIRQDRDEEDHKDEYSQYLREYTLYKIVKKYSDYVRYPIGIYMPHPVIIKREDGAEEQSEEYGYEVINSMIPLWRKRRQDVSDEEYDRFYCEHFRDKELPRKVIPIHAEGNVSFQALLYIPSHMDEMFRQKEFDGGLELYSSAVMISDHCEALIPECFSFVKGIVETEDIDLNISRETLQDAPELRVIERYIEKKIKAALKQMLVNERSSYEAFYRDFGRHLKLAALDNDGAKKDVLEDLLLFSSSNGTLTSLEEYLDRADENSKYIWFASGETPQAIDRQPQSEHFRHRGTEFLYFTDSADEFITDLLREMKGRTFRNIQEGDPEEAASAPAESMEEKAALGFIKEVLGGRVSDVRRGLTLGDHAVSIVAEGQITLEMERYFQKASPEKNIHATKILEINTEHPAFQAMQEMMTKDMDRAEVYAELYYQQAMLAAGFMPEDIKAYSDLIFGLWG